MAGFYNLDHKEVIRIKVKKCDGKMQPEYKKFSIDPQITSFEMLQGILARAFDIRSDFTISYQAIDAENQAVYLSMLSDWDMDAAFQCAAEPCLKLKVDLRPFEEDLEEWDVIAPADIPQHRISSLLDKNSILGSITGSLSLNLGRTVNSMQRAMGLKQGDGETFKPIKPPMSDMEFHNYLDSAGYMIKPNEFRLSIYQGGIETSLRRVAWRHLLNLFPIDMSGRERFDYMKRKEEEYRKLREEWRERFRTNTVTEEVKYVASMVKKDVLRTDRTHGFYAGNDENENTLALFHILVTYALTHPDTSYCQGMSDIASPLLVTQKDEAQAYICFCSLMERLKENFTLDGEAIMTKFKHLLELLNKYDPELHSYLVKKSSGDLFFCYRWFLLELKREFPFNDALHVLEVMWATLPPSPPEVELSLVASDYSCRLLSSSPCSPTFSFQQAMYAKLLAMRRVGALHRVTQTGIPVSKAQAPVSVNTNLSPQNANGTEIAQSASMMSSFDASPGDFDEKGADFPEIDNPMLRSLQKKSDSIDQVLLEAPKENSSCPDATTVDDEKVSERDDDSLSQSLDDNHSKNGHVSTKHEELERNDEECDGEPEEQFQCSLDRSNSYNGSDKKVDKSEDDIIIEFNPTHFSFEPGECERRCSMGEQSSLSESSEHAQFALSIDSNTNMSVDSKTSQNSFVHCDVRDLSVNHAVINSLCAETGATKNGKSESELSDTSSGIFQSMKRLLSSPKKRQNNIAPGSETQFKAQPSDSNLISDNYDTAASDGQSNNNLPDDSSFGGMVANSDKIFVRDPSKLPPPQVFGAGNPFLMFLCFTIISQHRDAIMRSGLCYEEIAMHFDRLVRRHNANRVLHHARQLYTQYLKAQQANIEKMSSVSKD